jgi:hypothetical protein
MMAQTNVLFLDYDSLLFTFWLMLRFGGYSGLHSSHLNVGVSPFAVGEGVP